MSNQIYNIQAYKRGSTWLFDDEHRQIKGEPFVCGASELITQLVGKRKRKASLNFSEHYIPDYIEKLTLTKAEGGKKKTSGWYIAEKTGMKCWLCPAQLKFFGHVAKQIYVI